MQRDPVVRQAIERLVTANAILYRKGVVDAFGHVSARHPHDSSRFLLSSSKAPATIAPFDIMEHGLDGEPCAGHDGKPYLERFIHSEIYKARADVSAIVHSHSPSVIPFGCVAQAKLRPIFHMSSFLGEDVPCFDIRSLGSDETDLLISSREHGAALAETLGRDATVVLMRGHGSTATGSSLQEAVFRAVYTEVNAGLQIAASTMGDVTYLSPGEALSATISNRAQIGRAWDLWASEAERR
ncbi:class II aldolase/adducin family protein [Sphingobium aquiterrae]|uniref:class II aldolase/adducin family protein n=1 Tax=Sphingobium aquiterrae TaxID=2038656 RepID=UPI00301AF091